MKKIKFKRKIVKKSLNGKHLNRRHIEDVPFYKLKYAFDQLPLDPFCEFLLGKIRK